VKVLVTGADGFVGQWMVRTLLDAGHGVEGTFRDAPAVPGILTAAQLGMVRWTPLDLLSAPSIRAVAALPADGVIHLAAVAGSAEAARDPGLALRVNGEGTAALLGAMKGPRRVVAVSSAEVYGRGPARPRRESDTPDPVSPYAESKLAGERAALAASAPGALEVMVARPFPHTGPGQRGIFMVPSFLERILEANRLGSRSARTGSLDPVRELFDVRDVAEAYLALLERGRGGEVYNVATGIGLSIREVFTRLAAVAGVEVTPEVDPALQRPSDVPHLVGDPTKTETETGWRATRPLEQTLRDLVDAQAH
jgi:GDP-4-dehydro-6-deoxy-D-mannose reductase